MAVIVRLIPPTSVLLVLVLLCMPGTWADYEKKPRGHSVYFIPESQASEKSYTVSKSLEVSDDREPRPESDSYSNVLSDGHSAEEEPVPDPEVYEFEYGVKDNSTGQVFSHKEGREGPDTQGEYRVLLPDGRYQIVEYTADKLGYRAKVSFEGDKTQSYPGSTPRPSYTPPPQYFQRRQAKKIEAPASHLYNSTHIASDHYIKVYHPPRKSVLHEATKQEYHETVNDQYLSGTRYTRPPPPSTPISETYVPPPSPEYQPPHPAPIYDLPTTTTTTISPPPVEYPQPPPIYPPPLAHRAVPAYATAPPPAYTPPPPPPVYYTTTITTTTPKPSYYSSSAKKESESHESNSTYYTVEVNGKGEDDGPPIQVIVKPHNVISITYSRPHANQPQTHIQVQHNSAVNTSDSVSESYSQSQHTHTHKATSYKPITVSRPVYVKTSADASSSTRTSTNHHYISEASQSHEVVTTADYAPSAHVYHTYKGPVISIPSYKAHTVHHHHQTNGQPYGSHEANYDLVIGYNKNYQPVSVPRSSSSAHAHASTSSHWNEQKAVATAHVQKSHWAPQPQIRHVQSHWNQPQVIYLGSTYSAPTYRYVQYPTVQYPTVQYPSVQYYTAPSHVPVVTYGSPSHAQAHASSSNSHGSSSAVASAVSYGGGHSSSYAQSHSRK